MADLTDIDNVAPADSLYQGSIKINAIRARLDELYTVLSDVTAAEATQVENIGATTISAAQWAYLGSFNQALTTTASPTFAGLTLSGGFTLGGALTLAGNVVCDDYAFTDVGNMTFHNGSILASGSTAADTLILKANDTACITLTTGATDKVEITALNALTAINDLDIGAHDFRCNGLIDDSLTSGRVVFTTTNGQLADDSDFTFDTATLTVTNIAAFNLTGKLTAGDTEIEGSSFDINGGTIDSISLTDITMSLGSDADGDIYYRASNKLTRLAKGEAAQGLVMNAGATAPEWSTPAGGGIDNVVEDTTPQLGGELDCQAHTIGFTQQTATGDGTTTIDWKLGNKFYFTFGAQNDTFTFTQPTHECNLLLVLKQDGEGSRLATWPETVMWPAGTAPTLTTTASAVDIISFYWDGTNYHGSSLLAFAVPA